MPCYISSFRHLSQVVLRRRFLNIFLHYGLNQGRPGVGPFETLGPSVMLNANFKHLSQVVMKINLFLICYYVFLWFESRSLCRSVILDPVSFSLTNLIKATRKCYSPNVNNQSQAVPKKKKTFKWFSVVQIQDPFGAGLNF